MTELQPTPYVPFSVSVVPNRDEVVVVAAGELDLLSAGELESAVAELQAVGFTKIVVDLAGVDFIDSTGLRTLIMLRNHAAERADRLVLVPPGPTAQRLFDLTGTRELFEWRDGQPPRRQAWSRRDGPS
jgi:anti-sigma B factor antagonist